jgi:hypothetical protein
VASHLKRQRVLGSKADSSEVFFNELDLPTDSNDRLVWQLSQKNRMILMTANRNMKGEDSLEQVLREDNTSDSEVDPID